METSNVPVTAEEADARALEKAASILRHRFGMLTAGDLVRSLSTCAVVVRTNGKIIRPAPLPGGPVAAEAGHGYHDAGDY